MAQVPCVWDCHETSEVWRSPPRSSGFGIRLRWLSPLALDRLRNGVLTAGSRSAVDRWAEAGVGCWLGFKGGVAVAVAVRRGVAARGAQAAPGSQRAGAERVIGVGVRVVVMGMVGIISAV